MIIAKMELNIKFLHFYKFNQSLSQFQGVLSYYFYLKSFLKKISFIQAVYMLWKTFLKSASIHLTIYMHPLWKHLVRLSQDNIDCTMHWHVASGDTLANDFGGHLGNDCFQQSREVRCSEPSSSDPPGAISRNTNNGIDRNNVLFLAPEPLCIMF